MFSFVERGAEIPEGAEPFDLPETWLRRDARRATVEVLIEREGLGDPFVLRLGRLVHDVEINAWATRREPGSVEFEGVLMEAFDGAETAEEALGACLELLDRLRDAQGDVALWLASGDVSSGPRSVYSGSSASGRP
jgi:hypothetical protein